VTCADGTTPRDFFQYQYGTQYLSPPQLAQYVLYCSDPSDGGTRVERNGLVTGCGEVHEAFPAAGAGPLYWPARHAVPSSIGAVSLADDLGGLWVGRLSSEVLTTVPSTMLGSVDAPLVGTDAISGGPVAGDGYDLSPGDTYQWTDAGFVVATRNPQSQLVFADLPVLFAGVDGEPDWGVFSTGLPLVVVATHGRGLNWATPSPDYYAFSSAALPAPVRAAVPPPSPDGGRVLLTTSQDTVYFAQLAAQPTGDPALAPRLGTAVVPQPRANITHVLAVPPLAGASYAVGYVIAGGRVYRVSADNPVVWRSIELSLSTTEAVALWKDGARVRVGYGDGAVYGLPSGTQLALPLAAASMALDYANVCGHSFMVTRDQLYQLVTAPGSVLGTWRSVPLAATGRLAQPLGRLQSDGVGLLIYRDRGVVERLDGLTCLPPQ
jgi:hypothetical protein